MSTNRACIEIRGIEVEIVRKDIKHLHLGVYPPEGRVRVAAPLRLDDDAVRLAVISRLAWIRRKRAEFEGQDRQSMREFVTGESHYFEGRRYRLDVVVSNGPTGIRLRDNAWMEMRARPSTGRNAREAMLYSWYRARLRERIPEMVAKWETEDRGHGGRLADPADEDAVGYVQSASRADLVEFGAGQAAGVVPRVRRCSRDGASDRAGA